jgi:hypothetical protein
MISEQKDQHFQKRSQNSERLKKSPRGEDGNFALDSVLFYPLQLLAPFTVIICSTHCEDLNHHLFYPLQLFSPFTVIICSTHCED